MKHLFALAFILSLFITAVSAQNATTAFRPEAQIKFTNIDTTYDFGDIPAQSAAQYSFEIKNTGNNDLIIENATCATGIVKVKWPNKPVKHGKKGLITVSITTSDIGSFKDDIYITSNATALPYPFMHISGAVIPAGDPGTSGSSPTPKNSKKGK